MSVGILQHDLTELLVKSRPLLLSIAEAGFFPSLVMLVFYSIFSNEVFLHFKARIEADRSQKNPTQVS